MDKRCVDIDDVLDLFGIEDRDIYAKGTIEDALYDGTLKVYKLPSAERHGRWIDVEHAPDNLFYATCSVCGDRQTIEVANYCPMCGASMEGSEWTGTKKP